MEEEKDTGANATVETAGVTETTAKNLMELINADKDLQSQFDKAKTDSIKTALANEKIKWEEEQKSKLEEAEKLAKMDAEEKQKYENEQLKQKLSVAEKKLLEAEKRNSISELKSETIKQASAKGISVDFISTINFEYETAESIKAKLDVLGKALQKEREKAITEYSKEPSPQTGDTQTQKDKTQLKSYEDWAEYYQNNKK